MNVSGSERPIRQRSHKGICFLHKLRVHRSLCTAMRPAGLTFHSLRVRMKPMKSDLAPKIPKIETVFKAKKKKTCTKKIYPKESFLYINLYKKIIYKHLHI